jgi:hypothetical protein
MYQLHASELARQQLEAHLDRKRNTADSERLQHVQFVNKLLKQLENEKRRSSEFERHILRLNELMGEHAEPLPLAMTASETPDADEDSDFEEEIRHTLARCRLQTVTETHRRSATTGSANLGNSGLSVEDFSSLSFAAVADMMNNEARKDSIESDAITKDSAFNDDVSSRSTPEMEGFAPIQEEELGAELSSMPTSAVKPTSVRPTPRLTPSPRVTQLNMSPGPRKIPRQAPNRAPLTPSRPTTAQLQQNTKLPRTPTNGTVSKPKPRKVAAKKGIETPHSARAVLAESRTR